MSWSIIISSRYIPSLISNRDSISHQPPKFRQPPKTVASRYHNTRPVQQSTNCQSVKYCVTTNRSPTILHGCAYNTYPSPSHNINNRPSRGRNCSPRLRHLSQRKKKTVTFAGHCHCTHQLAYQNKNKKKLVNLPKPVKQRALGPKGHHNKRRSPKKRPFGGEKSVNFSREFQTATWMMLCFHDFQNIAHSRRKGSTNNRLGLHWGVDIGNYNQTWIRRNAKRCGESSIQIESLKQMFALHAVLCALS